MWGRCASRLRTICLVIGTSAGLTACGAHLYDEQSHNVAKEAKTAIGKADYGAVIAIERENLNTLLAAEIQLSDQAVDLRRRLVLAKLMTSGEGVASEAEFRRKLAAAIDERFLELGITGDVPPEDLAWLGTLDDRLETYDAMLNDTAEVFFLEFVFPPPPCTPALAGQTFDAYLATLSQARRGDMSAAGSVGPLLFEQYQKDCRKVTEGLDGLGEIHGLSQDGGILLTSRQELVEAKLLRTGLQSNRARAAAAFKAAEEDLKEALATDPTPSELLKPKLDAVRKAFDALMEGADFIGADIGSDMMVAEIDAVLAGIGKDPGSEGSANPETAPAVAMLAALPAFADKAVEIGDLLDSPPVASLIIEKQRLKLLKAQAERETERLEQRIAILELRLEAAIGEVRSLIEARNAISKDGRRQLLLAVGWYLSTFTLYQTTQGQLDYRLIGLDHQIAVDRSEDALALWYVLIQQPADQLVAYFDSGIRREEILQLLQALGIVAGGVGLNR
jgi:hypothetical protein